jgi:hypothetical protein
VREIVGRVNDRSGNEGGGKGKNAAELCTLKSATSKPLIYAAFVNDAQITDGVEKEKNGRG